MLIMFSYYLFRLLQQLPKSEMINTVECWAKLVFPLLVSSAIKVHVVTKTLFMISETNCQTNQRVTNYIQPVTGLDIATNTVAFAT